MKHLTSNNNLKQHERAIVYRACNLQILFVCLFVFLTFHVRTFHLRTYEEHDSVFQGGLTKKIEINST